MKPRAILQHLQPKGPHNRRILLLVCLGLLALAVEMGLRAWEQHHKLEAELKSLRGRIQLLQASADPVDWSALTTQLESMQQDLQEQLWQAPSEAQAQAMMRDWLSSTLKAAAVQRPTLRLQPSVPAHTPAANSQAEEQQPSRPAEASERLLMQTIRVRAQISFELQPGMLETMLHQVERGGQLASVDALSVSKRNRRIEMSISMPVMIKPTPPSQEARG